MTQVLKRSQALRRTILRTLAAAGLVFTLAPAQAQTVDCGRLSAQVAAAGRGDPNAGARYQAALQRQQAELDRTTAYGRSIGCGSRQFLFFGNAPPAQCGPIDAQVNRMRANVAALQAQTQRAGDGQRRDLMAQFDAYCRQQPHGFFDTLFGGGPRAQMPLDDGPAPEPTDDGAPRGGSKAVCVRSCDGAFFPVSYSARRANIGELDDLCKALCPSAETQVYTYAPGGDVDGAVSSTGELYSALPNAGRYRTKVDPTCACKPANQSWVDALANAEQLLGRERRTAGPLTQAEADELSRPQPPKPTPASAKGKKDLKTPDTAPDPLAAAEIAASAAAPTAGTESADIATGGKAPRSFGVNDGVVRQEKGPDGVTRRVRTVGPSL